MFKTKDREKTMNNIHEEIYSIRSYEIDFRGRISIQSICRYLGEAAGNHAAELGASVEAMWNKKMTWVISRLHLHMQKYPGWRETVRIETWPSGRENLFAIRDYRISSGQGEVIGNATTSWMVIDLARKKPVPLPDFVTQIPIPDVPRALYDPFEKLPDPGNADLNRTFEVRLSDLDINQHVNFVNYIEWAVETVPAETRNDFRLEELEVSYRAESRYGDRIISGIQRSGQGNRQVLLHRLLRESDRKEVAVLRTGWSPR